jgi:hypothetical protein
MNNGELVTVTSTKLLLFVAVEFVAVKVVLVYNVPRVFVVVEFVKPMVTKLVVSTK